MNLKVLLVALLISVAMVSAVCAIEEPTPEITPATSGQEVPGHVEKYTNMVTISAPASVPTWNLVRGEYNQNDPIDVKISADVDPDLYDMKFDVAINQDETDQDETDWDFGVDNDLFVYKNVDPYWYSLTDGTQTLYDGVATKSLQNVPVILRQFVPLNQDGGDYTVVLTYTLSVVPKSP